jgi:cytochrome P450
MSAENGLVQDERKTAALATQRVTPLAGAKVITDFKFARAILQNPTMRQAGAGAEFMDLEKPDQVSFFFLDGEIHKKKRSEVARYFAPKAIRERYQSVMDRTMDKLISEIRSVGSAQLDLISFRMAVDVAAEVVGLTNSNPAAMSTRIRKNFDAMSMKVGTPLQRRLQRLVQAYRATMFLIKDVMPAIKARKAEPREDVISHLVGEGYTNRSILIECMTYATAGMLTTREFIVAACWYLFERDEVRQRYLAGTEADQLSILYEVLRMEPVAGMIHRRATADWTGPNGQEVKAGDLYAINIRAVNTDSNVTGKCPFSFDDSRAAQSKMPPMWMSFAEGPHRCPGNLVAIHETRVFLDRLLRVPGVRLVRPPVVSWFDAVVECDKA